MLFNLTNIFTTYQALINKALINLIDIIYVIYLDNILIFLKDFLSCVGSIRNRIMQTLFLSSTAGFV